MSRKPCKQCVQVEKRPIIVRPVTTQMTDDPDMMQKWQSEDKVWAVVRTWIDKGQRPTSWKEVNQCSATLKTYWSHFNRLCLDNGLVCRTKGNQAASDCPERIEIVLS